MNKCRRCGKDTNASTTTHVAEEQGKWFAFVNVPAQICPNYGEVWLDEATLQRIDQLLEEGNPTLTVPAWDFSSQA